jgi:hypothetical protein
MKLASFSTLVLAAILTTPVILQAVNGDLPWSEALTRYLIAVIIAAAMIAVLRYLTRPYREASEQRERDDIHRQMVERAEEALDRRRRAGDDNHTDAV